MKLLTINAESIWLGDGEPSASHASHEARDKGYQFFIYADGLFLIAYWRDGNRPDYIQLECDEQSLNELRAEIKALE